VDGDRVVRRWARNVRRVAILTIGATGLLTVLATAAAQAGETQQHCEPVLSR